MPNRHLSIVPPSRTRSKVTNGRALFVEGDGRGPWGRRFKDLCALYAGHIGGDPNAPQQALIRRIVTLDIECERVESLLSQDKRSGLDIDAYSRWSGQQRRLLEQLGFNETKRAEVNPIVDHFSRPVDRGAA